MQTIVATLLVAAVYRPLPKWSPIHGWELRINWRVPSLAAISRFLLFAGPICFVLLTKVVMYSEHSPLQKSPKICCCPFRGDPGFVLRSHALNGQMQVVVSPFVLY